MSLFYLLLTSCQLWADSNTVYMYHRNLSQLIGKYTKSTLGSEITITTAYLNPGTRTPERFYIQGGLHGNEFLTSKFVDWLMQRVRQNKSLLNQFKTPVVIDFIANINPDSQQRNNPRNINLNRNFSVLWGMSTEPQGISPFSEAETQAVQRLFSQFRYRAAIDIHGYLNWVVLPTHPQQINRNSKVYEPWYQLVKKNLSILPNYNLKTAGELGDGGAFEDWVYWHHETFAVCLEMKYPFRFFPNGDQKKYDSFLAYEKYIFKLFSGALKIQRPTPQWVEQSNKTLEGKVLPAKSSH